jgi:hypothetical protein
MSIDISSAAHTRFYTTQEGHAVIEQSQSAVVLTSPEQILTVINNLHACYDYCAAWKQPIQERT